jgi:hypothetical protein
MNENLAEFPDPNISEHSAPTNVAELYINLRVADLLNNGKLNHGEDLRFARRSCAVPA